MYYEGRKVIILSPCMCLGDDLVLSGAYTNTIPRRAAPGPQVRLQGEPLPQAPTLTKLRPSGVDDGVCVRGPQDQPQVNGSFSGFTGLSMQFTFMAVIYHNKARSAKAKRCTEQSLKETKPTLRRVLLSQWSQAGWPQQRQDRKRHSPRE